MKKQNRVELAGSYKAGLSYGKAQKLDKGSLITVTVRLRRKKELPVKGLRPLSRGNYEASYGAADTDVAQVAAFGKDHLLYAETIDLARRSIMFVGEISSFEEAFDVKINGYQTKEGSFRKLSGVISVPEDLKEIIEGVFGLDNRPIARPMFQVAQSAGKVISHAAAPHAYTGDQLAKIYGFPAEVTGKGQCVGIIELGGGYRTEDLNAYFKGLKIPKPVIKAISVDEAKNAPSTADSADGEVMLDIEVAGTVAPGANIAVYFAPNTEQGFLNAITKAIHDTKNKPTVISISWGTAEVNWTTQALDSYNEAFKTAAALGVTICAASGDSGSSDGEKDGKVHVDFPASSPYVLACGGTRLVVENNTISAETVWHASDNSASGGGVSDYFPLPDYQEKAGVPLALDTRFKGRGLPDVAGDADPDTGYKILVDGKELVIGGTSAVAPLMAGLIALVNEKNKKAAGFINPQIYSGKGVLRDIITGDNKTTAKQTGYSAGKGWDACTGLGILSGL